MALQSKEQEFRSLFSEFVKDYLETSDGENHLRFYDEGRSKGRENFEAVKASREDITDSVLRGLLPHTNSVAHRASGAWIHIAPTIQGDIKEWYEGAGWTRAEDWPKVARAIFRFVSSCSDDPQSLETACAEFAAMPYAKGLQTGQLSPILNATNPDCFLIINNKSRKVINYFTGSSF
jgi:5-methylcytosine-specific restriction protein B